MSEHLSQRESWEFEVAHQESLRIIATTPMPPPTTGNASIMVGVIPVFLGVRDPAVSAISFLQEGSPFVERRRGKTIFQQRIQSPSFCITPAGSGYEYRTSGRHTSLNIAVANASLEELAEREMRKCQSKLRLKACMNCHLPLEMIDLFRSFSRLVQSPRNGSRLYFETLWTQLALQLLWHHSSLSEHPQEYKTTALPSKQMGLITSYLQENLALDTSLSELAALVHLSPGHFLRAFKKATGSSPVRYRMTLRLKKACLLLSTTSLSITEIAIALGFSSTSHFSMTFTKKIGKNPSLYRAEQRLISKGDSEKELLF
jgi:AraC-like DNA-binding protein